MGKVPRISPIGLDHHPTLGILLANSGKQLGIKSIPGLNNLHPILRVEATVWLVEQVEDDSRSPPGHFRQLSPRLDELLL